METARKAVATMTGNDADPARVADILYRLKLAFGEEWARRLVRNLNASDRARLFQALIEAAGD
jgi:hypothetical protein